MGMRVQPGVIGCTIRPAIASRDRSLEEMIYDTAQFALADAGIKIDDIDGIVVQRMVTDGVVEALELPGESFVLAVQWHPEKSLDDLRLFKAVVEAARSYAGRMN